MITNNFRLQQSRHNTNIHIHSNIFIFAKIYIHGPTPGEEM